MANPMMMEEEDESSLPPKSDHHNLKVHAYSDYEIVHRTTFGDPDNEIFCVRFDHDDKYLALGCADGSIKIYNVLTGKMSFTLNNQQAQTTGKMPTTSIRWRPQGAGKSTKNVLISVNADGSVKHWHTTSGKCLHTIQEEFVEFLCIDYDNTGEHFACSGKEMSIRIYDEATRKLVVNMNKPSGNAPGHTNKVFSVKFDKEDPNTVLSGGWDSSIQIWDIRQGLPVGCLNGPFLCGDSLDILDGVILTGSWRPKEQIQIWDLGTRELIHTLKLDLDQEKTETTRPAAGGRGRGGRNEAKPEMSNPKSFLVYSSQFSKEEGDIIIAGGGGSSEVKLFDCNKYYIPFGTINELSRAVYSVDVNNSNSLFAFGGGDGFVRLFEINRKY
eukprot:CAMPEP_0114995856 /NCGR_PEP_ID=MMETSP0216-20121206/13973_1 /TAXON_ID=223996 /ORGANISM="Protocruzia adherens, Strain Boccale" /LENGTH=384 /DNA_ID=CAMNT_0002359967 /DNA_START=132 /DNA_END=1286 /DNA_ORIENTATION=+